MNSGASLRRAFCSIRGCELLAQSRASNVLGSLRINFEKERFGISYLFEKLVAVFFASVE